LGSSGKPGPVFAWRKKTSRNQARQVPEPASLGLAQERPAWTGGEIALSIGPIRVISMNLEPRQDLSSDSLLADEPPLRDPSWASLVTAGKTHLHSA